MKVSALSARGPLALLARPRRGGAVRGAASIDEAASVARGAVAPAGRGGAGAGAGGRAGAEGGSGVGARERLYRALRRGNTLVAAAVEADVPLALAEVMVDEMRRQGLLDDASSFCASGLGACHGGDTAEARMHCAGCPLTVLAPKG